MKNEFILENLDVYRISRELSILAWEIYKNLELDQKIIVGQQYVKSVDSIGANIAEGYGRYHYLDKIRFYYNARASLFEAIHWADILYERELVKEEKYNIFISKAESLQGKINGWIKFNLEKKKSISKINQ